MIASENFLAFSFLSFRNFYTKVAPSNGYFTEQSGWLPLKFFIFSLIKLAPLIRTLMVMQAYGPSLPFQSAIS